MKKRVLIFDDEHRIRTAWKERLEGVDGFSKIFQAEVLDSEAFREILEGLEQRQEAARREGISWDKPSYLDDVDILFVDYDLLTLYADKFEVGENVAYLARCYSQCRLVIALNQYGENSFDLTLRGHPDSFADLNLGSDQLYSPGLWDAHWYADGRDIFRPWSWPHLPSALESFERRRNELLERPELLDEPILAYLGLLGDTMEILPRRSIEFIQVQEDFERTTFRQFVEESANGLHRKDKGDAKTIAQVAIARIGKWLERLVLAGQDVLVDAPHLVTRFPGLIERDRINEVLAWDATVDLFAPGVPESLLDEFRFGRKDWLSRAAWFGRRISNSQMREQLDPWDLELPGFVFCEDRSRFRAPDRAREFVTDVPSPFVRRFVGEPLVDGVRYHPTVRFSL